MNKISLKVLGLSYSETQSGAYALILAENGGDKRIPIIIGAFEAQAIAIELEGLKPPRPLTHDLFVQFADAFKIEVTEINIYKLEEGVFFSNIVLKNEKSNIVLDSRTSDAVALALRFKCPIYTTPDVMSKAGIYIEFGKEGSSGKRKQESEKFAADEKPSKSNPYSGGPFSKYELAELEEMLRKSVEDEDYERASRIRDEINKRKK